MKTMEAIVQAVRETRDIRLADWSADPDHHRMVVTFVGPPEPVRNAALAAAAAALQTIDLRRHQGIHPRLGALDVLPFVPLQNSSLDECSALAREVGQELASQYDLPVFLYEAASAEQVSLPEVRRTAFRGRAPDYGPAVPHPTAGAVVVGSRRPLIAYNVNLAAPDDHIARQLARELRDGGGGQFQGIRALGLVLASRGLTQVSMNITRPAETPLLPVFSYIARRASELGTEVVESEVIGALPGPTAFGIVAQALSAALKPGQILLENWPTQ